MVVGYGLLQKIGHLDIYPNGGKYQPNCPVTSNKLFSTAYNIMSIDMNVVEDLVACGHSASFYFFTDSIRNKNCRYTAYPCSNIEEFNNGNCLTCSSKGCNQMGYWATNTSELGALYLNTQHANKWPYCLHNYQVSLTSSDTKSQVQTKGKFTITLKGSKLNSKTLVIDDGKLTFREGLIINRLIETTESIGSIIGAEVTFNKPSCYFFTCWYDADRWSFKSIKVLDGQSQKTINLCPKQEYVVSGSSAEFLPC